MFQKKRPPIEQLKAAGNIAKQMLVDKGILGKKSIINEILNSKDAPTLPGIPAYLPHQWTIQAAQRIMYDLLVIWRNKCKDNAAQLNDITEFFKFVVKELHREESEINKEIVNMPSFLKALKDVPVLKDVFSPIRKKENLKAMHHFFIDSFAVALTLKDNHTTSDYANWFLEWTQDLYTLWVKPEERKDLKRI